MFELVVVKISVVECIIPEASSVEAFQTHLEPIAHFLNSETILHLCGNI